MVKKPTKRLEQKIKQRQEWSKKANTQVFAHIAGYLNRCWERQIAKRKSESERLMRDLENYGNISDFLLGQSIFSTSWHNVNFSLPLYASFLNNNDKSCHGDNLHFLSISPRDISFDKYHK